jgi:4-alpha-glucanotransferase
MSFNRASGILLHPTSLPGPYGIGDLGPQAYRWIDYLSKTGCSLWQVLPLGPTGYGDSPYQCFSAFAGNFYLISPELLLVDELLKPDDLIGADQFPTERVDYGAVIRWKLALLEKAFDRFQNGSFTRLKDELILFKAENSSWLEDFALFMALKDAHGGKPWPTWEPPLRGRDSNALANAHQQLIGAVHSHIFRQFLFFRQWAVLRARVAAEGIRIIGDIPIFVAHDSADVWAHPELFYLDQEGKPTVVSGVPPDYFSATGQLWGNPLYRWDVHAAEGYSWWLDRFRAVLKLVDFVRLDHFRGFAGYWEVPGGAVNAIKGRWVPGPGKHFFIVVQHSLGNLPIIAEDLGVITPDVVDLRDSFGLPGMKIFQFAFAATPDDPFLPHNYPQNCVAYTGTHDNDTALGWYMRVPESETHFFRQYVDRDGSNVSWDMIRAVWSSVASFSLAPMQDFLSLDNSARMNYPGNPSGNWTWRMPDTAMSDELCNRIKTLNYLYSREKNKPPPSKEL